MPCMPALFLIEDSERRSVDAIELTGTPRLASERNKPSSSLDQRFADLNRV